MNSQDFRKLIVSRLHELLKKHQFKKKGCVFSRELQEVIHYITLQSSSKTTSNHLVVTINVGVYSDALVNKDKWYPQPGISSCQWWCRLGELTPDRSEKWWIIENDLDAERTCKEMIDDLMNYALRILDHLRATNALQDIMQTPNLPAVEVDSFIHSRNQ